MSHSKPAKPTLTVIVPALREAEFTRYLADSSSVLRILMSSQRESVDIHCAEQAVVHYQGYASVNTTEVPAGLCGWQAHGKGAATENYIACADPAFVKAEPDHASIHSAAALSLSRLEAEHMVAGLNSHFEADTDYRFHLGEDWRWYLSGLDGEALKAEPLSLVADRNVVSFLDPMQQPVEWRQLFNEIQMVLHSLPVNAERMERGLQPINSLWLWGGHPLPQRSSAPELLCFADDAFSRGLSELSSIECFPLQEAMQKPDQSGLVSARFLEMLLLQQAVELPGAAESSLHGESVDDAANRIKEGFTLLDQLLAWGMKRLARGYLGEIHLLACNGELLRMRRIDLFRFWSRKR